MGSQDPAKAQQLADQISKETVPNSVKGVSNAEAAITSDIIIWCPAVTYKSLPPNLLLDSSVQVQFHKFQIREFE
jgi:hypothetical protein